MIANFQPGTSDQCHDLHEKQQHGAKFHPTPGTNSETKQTMFLQGIKNLMEQQVTVVTRTVVNALRMAGKTQVSPGIKQVKYGEQMMHLEKP